MTEDRSEPPDKFREFVKKMARLLVPEDDVEEMVERRREAARKSGRPVVQVTARPLPSRQCAVWRPGWLLHVGEWTGWPDT
jgi:hypothetical protein